MDLSQCLKEISQTAGVTGCVLADSKGLCLGVWGAASKDSSGLVKAIADQARKLHPEAPPPVVALEADSKLCLIRQQGAVTAAVYKTCSG